jgi:hypothetical protein
MVDASRLSEIAAKLRVASSWVEGEREISLKKLADELDGNTAESAAVPPVDPEPGTKK